METWLEAILRFAVGRYAGEPGGAQHATYRCRFIFLRQGRCLAKSLSAAKKRTFNYSRAADCSRRGNAPALGKALTREKPNRLTPIFLPVRCQRAHSPPCPSPTDGGLARRDGGNSSPGPTASPQLCEGGTGHPRVRS